MNGVSVISRTLVAAIALVLLCAAGDDLGVVSGVVRDAAGKAVEGAKVTLTSSQTPPILQQTTSGREGQYRFAGVRFGEYRLAAELGGPGAAMPGAVLVSSSTPVVVDLTLTPSRPPLKFEAAGVRGLIDPGGYSAPANAAAASGLIAGIADIKRSGYGLGASARDFPCGLEPELKKSVEANPDKAEPNRRLGEFYIAHDQPVKAIPLLEQAHRIDGADAASARDLAIAWMKNGQFEAARELLTGLAAGQGESQTHSLLARAEEGSGMFARASEEYQIAAKGDPSPENLFGVGYELILAGMPRDAGKAFRAGLAQHPRSIQLLSGAGAAEFLQGHAAEGIVSFLQATDLAPSDPRPYSFLSSASGVSGVEGERVRSAFKRFRELVPENAQASYFYGLNLLGQRGKDGGAVDLKMVEELFKQAIMLDPNFAKAHFQLGGLYAERGDFVAAAREYEATVRLAPELREAHYRLAGAYRHTGRDELAAREMRLFEQARERPDSETGTAGMSIEQFVSVIDRPGRERPETQCPAAGR